MNDEIVIVTGSGDFGGAENKIVMLAKQWVVLGYDVTKIELGSKICERGYTLSYGIKVVNIDHSGDKRLCKYLKNIFDLLCYQIRHKQAIFLGFLTGPICYLSLTSFLSRVYCCVSERNNPYRWPLKGFIRFIRTLGFVLADRCVFQTQDAMEYFPKSVQKKGVIIPNPLDCSAMPDRFVGERRKDIIAAGRLVPQKNFALLLKAFAKFSIEHSDYALEIYGRGELEDELRKLAQDLGIADKVKMPGFATDIHDKMRDCAMYVSSSDYEGISNSMLEAMALGMPVVCTDCPIGGARQTITDGVDGLLVPVGDVEAMYLAMKRVVEEPGLAERLGNEAYKVRERYPVEKIAQQWLEAMGLSS